MERVVSCIRTNYKSDVKQEKQAHIVGIDIPTGEIRSRRLQFWR